MAAVDLPLGYSSGKAATQVIMQVYEHFKPKELNDTKVMYLHAHGPGLVHSKKPIRSALVVQALGGTPVPKPMPETYEMLQKGVVDGAVYPLEANKGWKLGEVTGYCTAAFSAAYTTSFFVVMNKDKWNALPQEVQKVIEEINAEWVTKHGKAWDVSDMEGIQFFLNQGGQLIGVDAKEQARWKKAVEPILNNYIKETSAKGINAKEVVDFTAKALAEAQ